MKPHCHWPNQKHGGGTRIKYSPLIGRDARCSYKHKEARSKLSNWMGKSLQCVSTASVGSEVRQRTGVRVSSQVFSSAFERNSYALSRLASSSSSVSVNLSLLHFLPARLLTQSPSNGSGQASSSLTIVML